MASTAPAEYAPGALVWARATGHGWWPSQVTPRDCSLVPPKVSRQGRSRALLLHFFGDSSWGWFEPGSLHDFEQHYAEHKDSVPGKGGARVKANWRLGVEEAKELLDARAGRTPDTSHAPIDMLNPETWPKATDGDGSDDDEEEEDDGAPARWQEPVGVRDCEAASSQTVLEWLRLSAKDPDAAEQEPEPLVGASARQLWSYLHRLATETWGEDAWRLRNRGAKRKASAAAARAAAAAAAAAAAPDTDELQRRAYGGALAVVLSDVPRLLRLGSVDPVALVGRRGVLNADVAMAHAEAAVLRFREAVCWESALLRSGREGDGSERRIGGVLRRKLRALGVMPAAVGGERGSKRSREGRGGARADRKASKPSPKARRAAKRKGVDEEEAAASSSDDGDGSSSEEDGARSSEGGSSRDERSSSSDDEDDRIGISPRGTRGATADATAKRKGKRLAADDASHHRRQPAKQMRLTPRIQRKEGGGSDDADGSSRAAAAVAPAPRVMERVEVVWVDYAGRLGSKEKFEAAFQRWCGERNKAVELPSVQGAQDAYALFAAVATRGGYDAVSTARGWRTVALMWHEPLKALKDAGARVQAAYKKALLGFEKAFAAGAPTRKVTLEVPVPQGRVAAGGAGAAGPSRTNSMEEKQRGGAPSPRSSAGVGQGSAPAGGRGRLVPVEESDAERRRLIIKFKERLPMPRDDALLRLAQRLCPELRYADVLPVAIRSSCHITFPSAAAAQAAEGVVGRVAPEVLNLESGCVASVKRVRTSRVAQDAAVAASAPAANAATAANGLRSGLDSGPGYKPRFAGQPPHRPPQQAYPQQQQLRQQGGYHVPHAGAPPSLPAALHQQQQQLLQQGGYNGMQPQAPAAHALSHGQGALQPPRPAIFSIGASTAPLLPPTDPRARRAAAQAAASQAPTALGASVPSAVGAFAPNAMGMPVDPRAHMGGSHPAAAHPAAAHPAAAMQPTAVPPGSLMQPADPRSQRMQAGPQAIPGIAVPSDPRRHVQQQEQQQEQQQQQQQQQQQPAQQQGYGAPGSFSQLLAATGPIPSPATAEHGQQLPSPTQAGGGVLSGINLSQLVSAIQHNQHSPLHTGAGPPHMPQQQVQQLQLQQEHVQQQPVQHYSPTRQQHGPQGGMPGYSQGQYDGHPQQYGQLSVGQGTGPHTAFAGGAPDDPRLISGIAAPPVPPAAAAAAPQDEEESVQERLQRLLGGYLG